MTKLFSVQTRGIVRTGLSLVDDSMDYDKLLAWIREHEASSFGKELS